VHVDFAVLADYALIDQQGKLSVLGIFQHVWVASFPAVHPRTHLVLRVRGRRTEIGEHRIQIRFIDDQEQELMGGEGTVQFGEPAAGVTEVEAGAVLVFDVPLRRKLPAGPAVDGGDPAAGGDLAHAAAGGPLSLHLRPTQSS
jgi:hypothetical protein